MKHDEMKPAVPMSEEEVNLRDEYLAAFAAAHPKTAAPSVCVSSQGWWYVDGKALRKAKLVEMRDQLLALATP